MPDIYATSTSGGVEIAKDITPYKDTDLLKKVVSGAGGTLVVSAEDLSGITAIRNYAFYGCSDLTGVTIPDSVTSIRPYAFYDCKKLTSITFPDNVTSIMDRSFSGCTGLTSLTIGNSVTSIETYAFSRCSSVILIICTATTPPEIQSTTFNNVPATCVIKVPAESVSAYKAATNWSARADYIQAIQ